MFGFNRSQRPQYRPSRQDVDLPFDLAHLEGTEGVPGDPGQAGSGRGIEGGEMAGTDQLTLLRLHQTPRMGANQIESTHDPSRGSEERVLNGTSGEIDPGEDLRLAD